MDAGLPQLLPRTPTQCSRPCAAPHARALSWFSDRAPPAPPHRRYRPHRVVNVYLEYLQLLPGVLLGLVGPVLGASRHAVKTQVTERQKRCTMSTNLLFRGFLRERPPRFIEIVDDHRLLQLLVDPAGVPHCLVQPLRSDELVASPCLSVPVCWLSRALLDCRSSSSGSHTNVSKMSYWSCESGTDQCESLHDPVAPLNFPPGIGTWFLNCITF